MRTLIRRGALPHARRVYAQGGRLADPPPFMQDALERLLYETARSLLAAYGLLEE